MLKDVEYIIYAKLLSNKIEPMMNYITSKQQTRYLQGRFIGLNLRRVTNIINHFKNEQTGNILVSIDFE